MSGVLVSCFDELTFRISIVFVILWFRSIVFLLDTFKHSTPPGLLERERFFVPRVVPGVIVVEALQASRIEVRCQMTDDG